MISLKKTSAVTLADLYTKLQLAIELEHSTIPPYLTANFSLINSNTTNNTISGIIGSVLKEEMLHMTIASNIMNAVGGSPSINNPNFIPNYPGSLPGAVEGSLVVGLNPFSKSLVQSIFMEIEEPANPIPIPGGVPSSPDGETIGEFYDGIIALMTSLERQARAAGRTIFTGRAGNQVTYPEFYPANVLFPITDLQTAVDAITIIKDQGEGTSLSPMVPTTETEGQPEPGHYYRFEEIVVGNTLQPILDPRTGVVTHYAFTGPPIPFDPTLVANMWPNPKMSDFPQGTMAYENCRLFNYNYTSLLNSLHLTFNGQPDLIKTALGIMFSLRLYAEKLLSTPYPGKSGYVAGPSFEYLPSL